MGLRVLIFAFQELAVSVARKAEAIVETIIEGQLIFDNRSVCGRRVGFQHFNPSCQYSKRLGVAFTASMIPDLLHSFIHRFPALTACASVWNTLPLLHRQNG